MVFFFFFQAEDGIRDVAVTGVQTCALPIYPHRELVEGHRLARGEDAHDDVFVRVRRGDRGHAELDLTALRRLESDLAVLRLAPLRDVGLRPDLGPRDDAAAGSARGLLLLGAAAV